MKSAVAGAITTSSAASARATCSSAVSAVGVHRSPYTGRPVRAWKVKGVTKRAAASVSTTSTRAPAWVSLLARSAAL